MSSEHPIILFDGVCNLCNHAVQWILGKDTKEIFRFAALQSHIGQDFLKKHGLDPLKLNSVVLITKKKAYTHSDAALEIASLLGGFWQILSIFKIIPRFIRDAVYNFIAKNRYRWFGKQESCWLPTKELKKRFID
jgi:predicted DCC family thiol-disulfide oxidoreductase YuxK